MGEELNLEIYKMAALTRNLEIGLFWQRSNYFLVLNMAMAAAFFSLKSSAYAMLLSIAGIIVSTLWVLVNLGSKFWQARWEYRLQQTEARLGEGLELFSATWETVQEDVRRSFGFRKRGKIHDLYKRSVLLKPSVTLMMTLLSVVFVVLWLAVTVIHAVT